MKNQLLLTTILCGCSMTAWSALPIVKPLSFATKVGTQADESKSESELSINMATGSFTATNGGGTWASNWKSSQSTPTIQLNCGVNNMSVEGSTTEMIRAYRGGQADSNYNLSIGDGYQITGYSLDFVMTDGSTPVTVTDYKGNALTSSAEKQHIEYSGLSETSLTAFALSGGNYGIDVTNFKVTYKKVSDYVAPDLRTYKVFDNSGSVPYRIPAIGTAFDGSLVAVADYRYSKADIGSGRVDLRLRISKDNGATWGDIIDREQFRGDGNLSNWRHDKAAYGDPCIVGDRESPRMMITSCSGFPGFFDSSDRHQGWARWYSDDNGQTWTGPEIIDTTFVYKPLAEVGHPVQGFFVGSGKIFQSRYIKKDKYYRLYCAGSTQQMGGNKENWVFYSDDFGETWDFLGGREKAPIAVTADEPKVEELPNGNVILSSRDVSGRYYNIFTFSGNDGISGSWGEKALSSSSVGGLVANNGCNGEIQIVPVIRRSDGAKTFIALQSLPTSGRTNVSIFYKDLTNADTYSSPANFAKNWDGKYQVSNTSSAYSTWSWQKDNALAFLYEENGGNGGYDIVYKRLDIPTITSQKYTFDESRTFEQTNIDWTLADNIKAMEKLQKEVQSTVDGNSIFIIGDKYLTDASQLECKFGHKEMGGTGNDATDISTLIDGDASTYYHTYWGAGNQPNGSHYMDVTHPDGRMFEGTIKIDVTRRSGASTDHITEFTISGLDDAGVATEIAVVSVPNAADGKEATCEFTIPDGVQYGKLRFNVTGTTNNRGYWHMAEFQLYPKSLDEDCVNAKVKDAYNKIEAAIAAAKDVTVPTAQDIQALQASYDEYLGSIKGITDNIKAMQNLVKEIRTNVDANTNYIIGDKYLTSASQLECKFGHKEMGGTGNDATDISTLIDGDASTYYHTYWGAGSQPNGSHYMDVTHPEGRMFEGTIQIDVTRRKDGVADHITEFTISGLGDDDATTQIAVVSVPNASAGEEATCEFTIPEGKQYGKLRFNVTGTTSNRGYWHMAEFQLYPKTFDQNCLNAKCGEAYNNLEAALAVAKDILTPTDQDIQTLQTAYDEYVKAINIITGINTIGADKKAKSSVYDLQGRKVKKMQKGVYVVNGKKVIR